MTFKIDWTPGPEPPWNDSQIEIDHDYEATAFEFADEGPGILKRVKQKYIVRQECCRVYESDEIEATSREEAERTFLSGNTDLDFIEELCDPPTVYNREEWRTLQGLS